MHIVRMWLRTLDANLERVLTADLANRFAMTPCRFVKELNREIGLVLTKPSVAVLSGCPFDIYMVYQVDWDTIIEDLPHVQAGKKDHIETCKKCQYLFGYIAMIQKAEKDGAH